MKLHSRIWVQAMVDISLRAPQSQSCLLCLVFIDSGGQGVFFGIIHAEGGWMDSYGFRTKVDML